MDNVVSIDVAAIEPVHLRAVEALIGHQLATNQRLVIHVTECKTESTTEGSPKPRKRQTVEDWTALYQGLSDEQIETIDKVLRTRANFTRSFP